MFCGFEIFLYKVLFGFGENDIVSCLAFCPSVCKLSFSVLCSPCCVPYGCSHLGEVVVFDLEAVLFFTVLSFK